MSKDDKYSDKGAVDVGSIIKQTLEEVLPAAIAASAAVARQSNPRSMPDPTRCSDCGQLLAGCKGKHKQAVIWCDDDEAAMWFDGIVVNGVRYKSPGPGMPITVPEAFDGEHIVQTYTKNERELKNGKKRQRTTGSIGPNRSTNVRPIGPSDYLR